MSEALVPIAPGGPPLPIYDRMCVAIRECVAVDEAKDIRDKTVALEAYYRQVHNTDAEREATNIRLRAERRCGELLKELARVEPPERAQRANATMGRSPAERDNVGPSPYTDALQRTGISSQSASRFKRLASVPEAEFEAALASPQKPSLKELIAEGREPQYQVTDDSLLAWGRIVELHRLLEEPSRPDLHLMTGEMRAEIRTLTPPLIERLRAFMEALP